MKSPPRDGVAAVVVPPAPRVIPKAAATKRPVRTHAGGGRHLSAGWGHTCAVLATGMVKCWGQGGDGQLGLGFKDRGGDRNGMGSALPPVDVGTGRTAVAVSAGGLHTCAVLDTGAVKCWGEADHGKLGLGDTKNRGGQPNEMGDALPAVDLGTGRTAVAVAAGGMHTCALLDTGAVKCWGDGTYGPLGFADQENRGDNPNEMGDALPPVDLGPGRTAVAVSAGASHSCALLDTGAVKCWGADWHGARGLGAPTKRDGEPAQIGDAFPAVDLGPGRTAVAVSAGQGYTCAVLDTGAVKCWGAGFYGALGLGDINHRGNDPTEMGDALPAVDLGAGRTAVAVSASEEHTCALLATGAIKCWGRGNRGQLGLGDQRDRGDEPNEMGDALPAVDLGGRVEGR